MLHKEHSGILRRQEDPVKQWRACSRNSKFLALHHGTGCRRL